MVLLKFILYFLTTYHHKKSIKCVNFGSMTEFSHISEKFIGICSKLLARLVQMKLSRPLPYLQTFYFSHTQACSKRYTQYLGTAGHIHVY